MAMHAISTYRMQSCVDNSVQQNMAAFVGIGLNSRNRDLAEWLNYDS